jgi:hypothetical protein
MLIFGRSRQYRELKGLLKEGGFYKEKFGCYHIDGIVNDIRSKQLLKTLVEVVMSPKLTHILLLKATLLAVRLIQVLPDI